MLWFLNRTVNLIFLSEPCRIETSVFFNRLRVFILFNVWLTQYRSLLLQSSSAHISTYKHCDMQTCTKTSIKVANTHNFKGPHRLYTDTENRRLPVSRIPHRRRTRKLKLTQLIIYDICHLTYLRYVTFKIYLKTKTNCKTRF